MKVPKSEFSEQFVELMQNGMTVSYFKYGAVKKAYPLLVNAIKCLELKLQKYKESGNTEHLVDIANYAMIEFMLPAHEKAHFTPTDSGGSSGRIWHKGGRPNQKDNNEE